MIEVTIRKCFFYFSVILGPFIVCANEYDVYKAVTANYDKNIRPVHDSSKATLVSVEIYEFTLRSMDQIQKTITFSLVLDLTWTDEVAHWNSSAYGGTETVSMPANLLWRPDIVFSTSLSTNNLIPEDLNFLRLHSDGTVEIDELLLVTNDCILSIEKFPFDQQSCTIDVCSWIYPISEVDLFSTSTTRSDGIDQFMGNGEWKLISVNSTLFYYTWKGDEYVQLTYTIVLKRQPIYYVCVLLIPTFLTATICLFGLFVPATNSGERLEKVNMGLGTLLSMAIILGIVAGEMPKSTTLPLLGFYVLAELLLCTIGVGISMLIMLAHQRATTRFLLPPSWLITIIFFNPKKCMKLEKSDRTSTSEKQTKPPSKYRQMNDQILSISSSLYAINQILEKADKYISEMKFEDQVLLQWTIIFDRIDVFFLVLFSFTNFIMSFVILFS